MKAFLSFLLDTTPSRTDEERVGAGTFGTWGKRLVSVATEKLKSDEQQRTGQLTSLWPTTGKDELWRRLRQWMESTVVVEKLNNIREPRAAYGKHEAALCIDRLMEDFYNPPTAAMTTQKIALIQWLLNTGERPSNALKTAYDGTDRYIRVSDITVRRLIPGLEAPSNSRWLWSISVPFLNRKAQRSVLQTQRKETAVFSPTHIPESVQFELAVTLIPLLIWRQKLVAVYPRGEQVPVRSVQAFLDSNHSLFRGVGDEPLFTALTRGNGSSNGGLVVDKPLTTQSLDELLRKTYAKVGLAGGGAFHFRFEKGDKVRILRGARAQANSLHHTLPDERVGHHHYSSGMQNIPVSRIMLEETPDEVEQLRDAGYFHRQLSSHAMAAVLAGWGDGSRGRPRIPVPSVDEEELMQRLEADTEMQRLKVAIEAALESQQLGEADREQAVRGLRAELSKRRLGIFSEIAQRLLFDHRKYLQRLEASGSPEEIAAAHQFLTSLDARTHSTQSLDWITGVVNSLRSPTNRAPAASMASSSSGARPPAAIDEDGTVIGLDMADHPLHGDCETSRAAMMLFFEGQLGSTSRIMVVHDVWEVTGACPYCNLTVARTRARGRYIGGPIYDHQEQDQGPDRLARERALAQVRHHLRHMHQDVWQAICRGDRLPPMNHELNDAFELPHSLAEAESLGQIDANEDDVFNAMQAAVLGLSEDMGL